MKYTLSILIDDKIGALSRIIELFSSRGYNIDSICSGACEEEGVQRLTLVSHTTEERVQKIIKLLEQIIFVYEVCLINQHAGVGRELMLCRIAFTQQNRVDLFTLLAAHKVRIIEIHKETVSFENSGSSQELNAMIEVLSDFQIIELSRTGEAAIHKR